MEKRSRKGNVEKEHKKQSEMGSGTMSSMTLGKKEKGKTSDDNGRANSTDNKANSDAQNKTQKHTSQREQLDLEKKISESEFAGLEVIPECSFKNTSVIMTRTIENTFYKFGLLIGHFPCWTIILSISLCVCLSAGMLMWNTVTDDEKLWTPLDSPFINDKKWIEDNFPKDVRYETVIIIGPNVLTAEYVQYLSNLNTKVSEARTSDGLYGYSDLCVKDLDSEEMSVCYQNSILSLWNYNLTHVAHLTDEEVRKRVTEALKSDNSSIKTMLSDVTLDPETHEAVSASAIMSVWLLRHNGTKVEGQKSTDLVAQDWELAFIDIVQGADRPSGLPEGAKIEGVATRSFDDEITEAVNSNMSILAIGCCLIFIYIALVLGRFNALQQRMMLSVTGMVVIALSIASSYGLCFFMGIFYADMHPIIPFLLMGIGVDDMFVIVQSLENMSTVERSLPVPQRIALTMKHAGISITVTSVTDIAAFLIGSTTNMPILRAFCLFSALGVFFLYLYAATFFVGCLAIDEQRMSDRKVSPCSKPKPRSWVPNKFSQKNFGRTFFGNYFARYLLTAPVKVLVITVALAIFGVGVYGVTQLETDYNPVWYMRESSYQQKFFRAVAKHFPEHGERVHVYLGDIKYWEHVDELLNIDRILKESMYINNDSVVFWFSEFHKQFCVPPEEDYDWGDDDGFAALIEVAETDCTDERFFKQSLLFFLNENRNYYPDLKFNVTLNEEDYNKLMDGGFEITASRGNFRHRFLPNTTIQIAAMDDVKEAFGKVQFDKEDFRRPIPYSILYVQWEANKLLSKELVRNVSLTFCAIVVVTFLMVAELRVSLLVLLSVVFTVSNVAGYSHFMGLTIEIVTSMLLILSCGLALDYSAHIGVAYITYHGGGHSRQDKAKGALVSMGAPVFHGGFSTFTAIVMLVFSDSYIFLAFFKMFAMVVLFGLFHGIFFLPVLLSLFGPEATEDEKDGGGIVMESNDSSQQPPLPVRHELPRPRLSISGEVAAEQQNGGLDKRVMTL